MNSNNLPLIPNSFPKHSPDFHHRSIYHALHPLLHVYPLSHALIMEIVGIESQRCESMNHAADVEEVRPNRDIAEMQEHFEDVRECYGRSLKTAASLP